MEFEFQTKISLLSSCRQHHKKHKSKSSGQAVSFYIDEEEKEHLLSDKKPEIEIVVDPPSRDHSDNEERDNKIWLPPATPNRGCPTPKSLWYLLFLGVLFIIKYSVRCFILNMNLVMLHFYMVHEKMSKLFILVFVFLEYICLKSVCYFSFIHVAQLYVNICFYL